MIQSSPCPREALTSKARCYQVFFSMCYGKSVLQVRCIYVELNGNFTKGGSRLSTLYSNSRGLSWNQDIVTFFTKRFFQIWIADQKEWIKFILGQPSSMRWKRYEIYQRRTSFFCIPRNVLMKNREAEGASSTYRCAAWYLIDRNRVNYRARKIANSCVLAVKSEFTYKKFIL